MGQNNEGKYNPLGLPILVISAQLFVFLCIRIEWNKLNECTQKTNITQIDGRVGGDGKVSPVVQW